MRRFFYAEINVFFRFYIINCRYMYVCMLYVYIHTYTYISSLKLQLVWRFFNFVDWWRWTFVNDFLIFTESICFLPTGIISFFFIVYIFYKWQYVLYYTVMTRFSSWEYLFWLSRSSTVHLPWIIHKNVFSHW